MCGRKTLTKGKMEIIENLLIEDWNESSEYTPSYNIAPTDISPILRSSSEKRSIKMMRWGLIPSWAKDTKFAAKMINARSETLREKPSYRNLLDTNRCIIVADGFYEWKKLGDRKQPYYIQFQDHSIMPMAGLWSRWEKSKDETIFSYTVITTKANQQMSHLHERMPVILSKENLAEWISTSPGSKNRALNLLKPYEKPLRIFPVSTQVNSIRNNEPACIEKIDDL